MIAKLILYKNDGETQNGFPVKLVLSSGKKTRRKTVGYASVVNWNELTNKPKSVHPDFEYLYGLALDVEKHNVKASFRALENFDNAFALFLDFETTGALSVSDYFDKEIERLNKKGRFGTADNYAFVKRELESFSPGLKLAAVDADFVLRWKYHKRETVGANTLRTYLGRFRALYNKALEDPAVQLVDKNPFALALKGLHVKRRRKKNRYLDDANLLKFAELLNQPITNAQRRTVALSMLQFYFCGLNLKDLYFLKRAHFYKDRVLLSRAKLGKYKEEFDVKVFPGARRLLKLLEGPDPVYFFPWAKEHKSYLGFIANHNKRLWYLQEKYKIQLTPTDTLLNTNTFRHTFATRAKFLGVDADTIRELMGHERNDIDTVYKDKFPEAVRDAAHLRVITL